MKKRISQADLIALGQQLKSATLLTKSAGKPTHGITTGPAYHRNEYNGTPIFMDSDAVSILSRSMGKIAPRTSPADIAMEFIDANKDIFILDNPREELQVNSETVGIDGKHHIQFDQMYHGIPVWGNRLVVHLDTTGKPYAVNGRYSPTPGSLDTGDIHISEILAKETAIADLSRDTVISEMSKFYKDLFSYDGPTAILSIWVDRESNTPHLAWHLIVRPNEKDQWYYFIDALTGGIIEKYNNTSYQTPTTATVTDALGVKRTLNVTLDQNTYYLIDSIASIYTYDAHGKVVNSRNIPSLVSSPDNTWSDSIAVSAHYNSRVVYNYYLDNYNRQGVDGKGSELPVIIHYTLDGTQLYNAFWNGKFIAFGDAAPFAAALDVVAHELTHGVVQFTAGLEYKFQSGALNEAYADVMACMVDPDWEIAEDLPEGPLRDVSNPKRFGLPDHMSGYRDMPLSQDEGGVHYNMSIPSRAGYLMAQAIGRDNTAIIWYNILKSLYLTPKSQFVDMRLAAIQSATDLFGEDSVEVSAVRSAFDVVGIIGDTPSQPPVDLPPASGESMIAFLLEYGFTSALALAKPDIKSADEIIYPTETNVFTGGSSPITICKDGSALIFIDNQNNLRTLNLDTGKETMIDSSGVWSSVKLSPDGKRLAATTTYSDSTIYVLDLADPEKSKAIPLYTASTEGVTTNTAIFADALDWDQTGTYILYDAFHQLQVAVGNPIEFWDVNMMEVESGIITRVRTPTDSGIQVGNPSFAETNDRFIVCDLFSEELRYSAMVTIDLYSFDIKTLRNNGMLIGNIPNLGHPKYSSDDKGIVFQQYNSFERADILYQIPLKDDKMSPDGTGKAFSFGSLPVWFVRGTPESPSDVEEEVPLEMPVALYPNFPNPFNPSTTIPFSVAVPGVVTLTVYDLLGQEVGTLVRGYYPAGNYMVRFDGSSHGSGTYLYRIETGDHHETGRMTLVK